MASTTRTLNAHGADILALDEAFAYWGKLLEKPIWQVSSDVLSSDRSYFGIRDAATGMYEFGEIERTAGMWKYTSVDGIVIRGRKLDTFVIRIL